MLSAWTTAGPAGGVGKTQEVTMTTFETHSSRTGRSLLPTAAAAGVTALLLMLIGTYVGTPYKAQGSGEWEIGTDHNLGELPLLVAFAIVGSAVVFGVVVARGLRAAPETAALRSLIVAAVGVLSIAVFWSGLPVLLAAGAATLAFDARDRLGRLPRTGIAALALSVGITIAAVWLAFAG
jgi:hypothetical protein